jgi:hypothetical protein
LFQTFDNLENLLWLFVFLIFFLIYFAFWINLSYFWHYISENGYRALFFFNGLKLALRGLKSRSKTQGEDFFQAINQKLLSLLTIRWFFLITLLFLLILNLFPISELSLGVFLVFYLLISLTHLLYELEAKNNIPGYDVKFYGSSFSIYELLSSTLLLIWIISNNQWDFNNFRIFPWSFDIGIRIIQTLVVLMMIFTIARSANYLGYKGIANYEKSFPISVTIPSRISTLQDLSQLFFQTINIFLLSILTIEQTYYFLFGKNIELWLYMLTFLMLLFFYSLIILFFSSVTYRVKQKNFSAYLIVLIYIIALVAVLLFFLTLIL